VKSKPTLSPPQRLRKLHRLLEKAYGPQHWWPAETPFEVVLGAYLTQNTSWTAAARSLANLRAAGALTLAGLRELPLNELQVLIRPSGFATRKAPALKAFVAMLDDEFDGSLDALAAIPTHALRTRLLALPGVGPETADAILLYALNHPVPVVDEYLRRIAVRHTLANPGPGRNGYEQLADMVRVAFAAETGEAQVLLFNQAHALVVAVGKAHCRKVARCDGCPLKPDLPSGFSATGIPTPPTLR
jgi:endonuclease-3 related protein